MTRRKIVRYPLIGLAALLLLAVSARVLGGPGQGGDDSPPVADVSNSQVAVAGGEAIPGPPTRPVRFVVALPGGTEGPVWLRTYGLTDTEVLESVALEPGPDGLWTATVEAVAGSLLRYRYDRSGESEPMSMRAETPDPRVDVIWRVAVIEGPGDEPQEWRDTVAMWRDAPVAEVAGARVSGVVVDAGGRPVPDVEVTVAGMSAGSGGLGRFVFPLVPAGEHTLTVFHAAGATSAESRQFSVMAGEDVDLGEIVVAPRALVPVTFEVTFPEPPEAGVVSMSGSALQAGARPYLVANNWSTNTPVTLERLDDRHARVTLDLYEGQWLMYRYHLGMLGGSDERVDQGARLRTLLVPSSPATVADEVSRWKMDGQVFLTVRVRVPDNTPPGVPVQLHTGPGYWMTEAEPGVWATVISAFPGNTVRYRYTLGENSGPGVDTSPGLAADGTREATVGDGDTVVEDTVEAWLGLTPRRALAAGESTSVTVRLSLPPEDEGRSFRLAGDLSAALAPLPGNPSVVAAVVPATAGSLSFRVEGCAGVRGVQGPGASEGGTITYELRFEGEEIDLWAASCAGDGSVAARDQEFIRGMFLQDFFSSGFERLTPHAYDAVVEENGGAVAVSAVFSYGETLPRPTVEYRSLYSGAVLTPRQSALAQAQAARERGLEVFLAAQFNMELTPGGLERLQAERDADWFRGWLEVAEDQWAYDVGLANEMGATLLNLPGPVFHVFEPAGFFPTAEDFRAYDQRIGELIQAAREQYQGKILMSGGVREMESIRLADYVGITTYDLGRPDLPMSASLAEWDAAYEALFQDRVDSLHSHFGLPVLFYTIHVPSEPTEADPSGEVNQAKVLEAIYRAIDRRPWIAGAFAWAYTYTPAWDHPEDGFRGRLGAAVQAKWFERFAQGAPSR